MSAGAGAGAVHRILVSAAVTAVGQAAPTAVIGIDETRARSVRWTQQQDRAQGCQMVCRLPAACGGGQTRG